MESLQDPHAHSIIFNLTTYQENEANRWKFLDEIEPDAAGQLGFLLKSPIPVLTLTGSYIMFVCFIGPFIMRNREPFQLKNPIRIYNLLMVFLAGVLLSKLYASVDSFSAMFDCSKAFSFNDQSGTKVYQMGNFILMVRVSEYMDTIFFTLRKKQNQVTFLHVFHHSFVPLYAYWILRTAPLRFNVYIILINSAIHVLMYFYYFLATFQQTKKEGNPGIVMMIVNKLLMFKKYMTQLQILQFVSLAFYVLWAMLQPDQCGIPRTYIIANFLLATGFLGLFLHFYMRAYKDLANKKQQESRNKLRMD